MRENKKDGPEFWCEFVEIDDKDVMHGREPDSKFWRDACRKFATKIYIFANYKMHVCSKHYEELVNWCKSE